MSRDEIIAMAYEAGFHFHDVGYFPILHTVPMEYSEKCFERFAEMVAAKVREDCAILAAETVCDTHTPTGIKIYGARAAKAIRARGKQ